MMLKLGAMVVIFLGAVSTVVLFSAALVRSIVGVALFPLRLFSGVSRGALACISLPFMIVGGLAAAVGLALTLPLLLLIVPLTLIASATGVGRRILC